MPRYAAVDIGSNSVRMLAAEVNNAGKTAVLAEQRQVTRLGASVFQHGRISEEAIQFVCDTLARMAQAYKGLDVLAVRAVATSAVRDAGNQVEFLDRASVALGTRVETISGQEEARLIHAGVQARWPHPSQRVLILDVGGGSAEAILSDDCDLVQAFSRPLGAVRLTEVFLKHDPPQDLELHRLREYIDEKLAPAVKRFEGKGLDRVIATSATAAAIVCTVNQIPRPRRDEADRLRASSAAVRRFYDQVAAQSLAQRRKVEGIGPRRAEIIVAGAAVFSRALELFGQRSIYYSAAGVRDGIIADLAARGAGRELSWLSRDQRRTVESMARRYGVQPKHAGKVAEMTRVLFDELQTLHKLPVGNGKLLEAAAYLHDIGHFVSDASHHKHSQYLVQNSDLPGFTEVERKLIALLCRYHRKSMPQPRHDDFQQLPPEMQRAVLWLTPLLRLADSLDRSHEQRVQSLRVERRNGTVVLGLESDADADLELWAAEPAADLFRQIYGADLVLAQSNRKRRPSSKRRG
jgi:exopolyphosphatase/guanosine-5'-triphosphate,3'-diphosphate pyrophosphatase